MGDQANPAGHVPKADPVRTPDPSTRDVWQPLSGTATTTIEADPFAQSAIPHELTRSARRPPERLVVLQQVAGPTDRQRAVLHLQRLHGNSHAARTIERDRARQLEERGGQSTHPLVEPLPFLVDTDVAPLGPRVHHPPGENGSPPARSNSHPSPAPQPQSIQRDWTDDLSDLASSAASTVADTASSAASTVADTASSAASAVGQAASDAASAVGDAASTAAGAVSDAASDLAAAAQSLLTGAIDQLSAAYDAVASKVGAAWSTLKEGVGTAITGAIEEATGFLGGLGSIFAGVGQAIVDLDVEKLKAVWAAISSTAGMVIDGVKGVATRILSTLDRQWDTVKSMAGGLVDGLRGRAEGLIAQLPTAVQGTARSVWAKIEAKATGAWTAIESAWTKLRTWATDKLDALVSKVEGLGEAVSDSVIAPVIEALSKAAGVIKIVKQAIENPDAFIQPMVDAIVGMLQDLPGRSQSEAQTRITSEGKGGQPAAAPAAGPTAAAPAAAPAQRTIRRDPAPEAASQSRSTQGVGEAIGHVWDAITTKIGRLWGNLGEEVWKMVKSLVYPPATIAALKEDWALMTKELSARASRWESIRTDSFDAFWHDLRRFISNLLDFPLIVWRGINAMLGHLSVYIGLALILGGAVAGFVAGLTGGAVFGSVVPGAGTAAGGGGGALAGAWAGAQAGYALAETVGLVLLASFVVAEQTSIGKAIADLLFVPQSTSEQEEDVNQISDSIIALVAAALLMAIAFIGVKIAQRIWALIRGAVSRLRPRPTTKPTTAEPTGPKPVETPTGKGSKIIICRTCVELKLVPEDIVNRRAKLSPEMQQYLDEKMGGFIKDPLNPTAEEFARLRKMMDGIEKANGGDLEAGLKASKARENPAAKPPFGSEAAELPRLRNAAEQLLAEIDDFIAKNPDAESFRGARKRLVDDMEGVLKDMESGKKEVTPERVEGFDNNLKGIQGEFDALKSAPKGTKFGQKKSGREIDRISPDGTRWTNDKTDNLFGKTDPRVADLADQAKATIEVAQLPEHAVPVPGGPPGATTAPQVEFHFRNGVTPEAAAELRKVTVNGQSLIVTGKEIPLPTR